MENISKQMNELINILLLNLKQLTHTNGLPLIKFYGSTDNENHEGTFLLNFFDEAGQLYSLHEIIQRANNESISFRTVRFCSPCTDEINHDLLVDEFKNYFTYRDRGEHDHMLVLLGEMGGTTAVCISVGFPTTKHDIEKFSSFAKKLLNEKAEKNVAFITIL
jgi:selenocysteine lyase/cysteine desulfurase